MRRVDIGARSASRRLIRACCRFGIGISHGARCEGSSIDRRREMALASLGKLPPGQIALVLGPSGSGKSTLLRRASDLLARSSRVAHVRPPSSRARHRAVVDLLPGGLDRGLGVLGLVGLADPLLLARTYGQISDGEKARLDIARAILAGRSWVVADEFLSVVDRPCARAACRAIARAIEHSGARLLAASAHSDIGEWLSPGITIVL